MTDTYKVVQVTEEEWNQLEKEERELREIRYQELVKENCKGIFKDSESLSAFFYILSHNETLYDAREDIYDFENTTIKENMDLEDWFSGSVKALLEIALNLFNPYESKADVHDTFIYLTQEKMEIAFHAIRIRTGYMN